MGIKSYAYTEQIIGTHYTLLLDLINDREYWMDALTWEVWETQEAGEIKINYLGVRGEDADFIIPRDPEEILTLSVYDLTEHERLFMSDWIKDVARKSMGSLDYNYLLGWWMFDDWNMPVSPKEAGME